MSVTMIVDVHIHYKLVFLVPVKWCCFPLVRHRILGVEGWQMFLGDRGGM